MEKEIAQRNTPKDSQEGTSRWPSVRTRPRHGTSPHRISQCRHSSTATSTSRSARPFTRSRKRPYLSRSAAGRLRQAHHRPSKEAKPDAGHDQRTADAQIRSRMPRHPCAKVRCPQEPAKAPGNACQHRLGPGAVTSSSTCVAARQDAPARRCVRLAAGITGPQTQALGKKISGHRDTLPLISTRLTLSPIWL